MRVSSMQRHGWVIALAAGTLVALAGCGKKEATPAQPAATAPAEAPAPPASAPATPPLAATAQTWTPEQLEALLAPVALYPDPVLAQVLRTSTNPQEVLDAGNWLVLNPDLKGGALDKAATEAGFTPPMRALMQFRETVDMMCMEMGWTTELGQAVTNDQSGVLAAVQRLRQQAIEVGNLKTTSQMKVVTQTKDDQQAVVIEPPNREVIYVPTYNPVNVYTAPPATTTTTTTTTTEEDDDSDVIVSGIIGFGVGLLVADWIHDDDYYHGYPSYWGGYMPPYPPYPPYRPVYGGGYRPGYGYNRPIHYGDTNININRNTKIRNQNNYWNSYEDRGRGARPSTLQSPITAAKPNRTDLARLNEDAKRPRAQGQARPATAAKPADWKGQQTYAGARTDVRQQAKLPPASKATADRARANAATARGAQTYAGADRGYAGADRGYAGSGARPETTSPMKPPELRPEFQGSRDAGQRPARAETAPTRDISQPAVSSRQVSAGTGAGSSVSGGGGGYRSTAMAGSSYGSADRAASQRGRSSTGGRSGGGGGGGGRSGGGRR